MAIKAACTSWVTDDEKDSYERHAEYFERKAAEYNTKAEEIRLKLAKLRRKFKEERRKKIESGISRWTDPVPCQFTRAWD